MSLLGLIRSARRRICVLTPNYNDPWIHRELVSAQCRGVCVRLMMCDESFNGNHGRVVSLTTGFTDNIAFMKDCPSPRLSSVRTYEKKPARWKGHRSGVVHAKVFIVDDAVMCGSLNATVFSTRSSCEIGVEMHGPALAERYRTGIFEKLWLRGNDLPMYI